MGKHEASPLVASIHFEQFFRFDGRPKYASAQGVRPLGEGDGAGKVGCSFKVGYALLGFDDTGSNICQIEALRRKVLSGERVRFKVVITTSMTKQFRSSALRSTLNASSRSYRFGMEISRLDAGQPSTAAYMAAVISAL